MVRPPPARSHPSTPSAKAEGMAFPTSRGTPEMASWRATDPALHEGSRSPRCACGSSLPLSPISFEISASQPQGPGSPGAGRRLQGAARHLPLLPALALVLLPKCPLCFAAYGGIFGSLGASAWGQAAWGLPLESGLLVFALSALTFRGFRVRDLRPPLLGLVGAAALLGGRFLVNAPPLLYAGAGALVLASLWSARLDSCGEVKRMARDWK